MKQRKQHEFTKEELDMERTPVNFNSVPWRTYIRFIRQRINEEKEERKRIRDINRSKK